MKYRLIEVKGKWHVAFRDQKGYGDFVIEFSKTFDTEEEADFAARSGAIRPLNTSHEK